MAAYDTEQNILKYHLRNKKWAVSLYLPVSEAEILTYVKRSDGTVHSAFL